MAVYQVTFFAGTRVNGVAVGTIVTLGSAPLAAGLFEWLIRRRRPNRSWLLATSLAVVGVVLLSGGAGNADLAGLALSITAGVSYALELVLMKIVLNRGWSSSDAVSWVMGLAAVMSVPVLFTTDAAWLATPRGAAVTGWLALGTIVVSYQLLARGLGGLPAATVTTLTLAEPATATLLGLLVVGERLTATGLAGIITVAGGLIVLARAVRNG
jgi:DME family drug/metabolite transporter